MIKTAADKGQSLACCSSEQQSRLVQAFYHFEESNRRVELDRNQVSMDFKNLMIETLRDINEKTSPEVWLDRLRILQPAMANVAVQTKQISTQQAFLRTLGFDEMRRRRFNVVAAHLKTCEWVFQDYAPEQDGEKKRLLLSDWLKNRSGHFWLQGKPGSGKSTLMKFICGNSKTRDLLNSWASSAQKRLVTAEFFFWHSGSPLEKSQEGLLRSLLFGILSKCPDLIDEMRSGLVRDLDSSAFEWTREELFEIFGKMANQELPFRFCFFIDGLDEYAGSHEELVETLERLMALPDIKLCLSSRPWPVFKDAFGKESDPWLRLQDLTRGDIRRFVSDKFHKNASFQTMAARDSQYHQLIEEVVNRAQGVFLWVYLVVQSLLQGLSGRDPMSDLYYRLDRLPQDLNEFFRHMISQIDDAYLKSRTVKMFQLALTAPEPPLVAIYTIVDEMEQDPDFCERDGLRLEYFEQLKETTERRLEARCKGLLEVSNLGSARAWGATQGPFFRDKVVFLHRTVRDFLNSTSLQELFGAECDMTYDAEFALFKATGAAIRVAATDNLASDAAASCDALLDQLFYHAHKVEESSRTQLKDETMVILEQVEKRMCGSTWWKWRRKTAAFVGSAVGWDLRRFVTHRVQSSPKLMKTRERPLLDHALVPGKAKYLDEELRSSAMVNILLAVRAKPNLRFNDSTPWVRFLQALKDHPELAQQEYMVDITRSLIGAGADPNVVLQKTEVINVPRRKATGRSSDLYKPKGGPKKISKVVEETRLEDVLEEVFGSDRCAFIMSARPCSDSKPPWQGLGAIFELVLPLHRKKADDKPKSGAQVL